VIPNAIALVSELMPTRVRATFVSITFAGYTLGTSVIGAPVLIDMKPRGDRWNGRIYNVKNGKTYTANIRLKNANTLRVEGCAFGGFLCGGQDWSRVN